jgi:hypothetical protein
VEGDVIHVGTVERCAAVHSNIENPTGPPIPIVPGDTTTYDVKVGVEGAFVKLIALPCAMTPEQGFELSELLKQASLAAFDARRTR